MKTLIAAALLTLSTTCYAEPETWLQISTTSYHFNQAKGYNQNNLGLGIEYQFNDDHAVMAGLYRNSVRNTTHYAAYRWTPLHLGNFSFGALAGAMDGYRINNGGWFAAVLPTVTWERGRWGANIVIIPTMKDKIDGAIALQVKWRF